MLGTRPPPAKTGEPIAFRRGKRSRIRRILLLLKDVALLMSQIPAVLLKVAAFLLILGFCVLLVQEVSRRTTTIEPISVPPKLAERGYTSEVAARLLRDGMNGVIGKASAPGPALSMRSDLPDIVVPTVGLSLGTISAHIRALIHSGRRTVISGEIGLTDGIYSLRLRINGQPVLLQRPFAAERPDAWEDAAAVVIRETAPYLAMWALDDTDPGSAVLLARQVISAFPQGDENISWAYVLYGSHLLEYYDAEHAEEAFRMVLKTDPKIAIAHAYLGNALTAQQKYSEAVNEYQEAIRLDPHDAAFYFFLGVALRKQTLGEGGRTVQKAMEQFRTAKKEFNRAIAQQPGDATAHVNFGNALAAMGAPDVAISGQFRRAVELDPRSARAHRDLCWILMRSPDSLGEAARECKIAVDLAPLHPQGFWLLGQVRQKQGRDKEALNQYKRAIKLDPNQSDFYVTVSDFYRHKGDGDTALAQVDRALQVAPRHADAHMERGMLLWERVQKGLPEHGGVISDSNWAEIKGEFDTVIGIDPTLAGPHRQLADILETLNKTEEAETEVQRARELDQLGSEEP